MDKAVSVRGDVLTDQFLREIEVFVFVFVQAHTLVENPISVRTTIVVYVVGHYGFVGYEIYRRTDRAFEEIKGHEPRPVAPILANAKRASPLTLKDPLQNPRRRAAFTFRWTA
jgi:hypothetical protein